MTAIAQPEKWAQEVEYQRSLQGCLESLKWRTQSHRDEVTRYIPDVSFAAHGKDGWIEVKYKYDMKSSDSLSSIKHYTGGQKKWLKDFGRAGSGHCYLWLGNRHGHFVWRWDALDEIHDMPICDAVARCMSNHSLTGLALTFDAMIRRIK